MFLRHSLSGLWFSTLSCSPHAMKEMLRRRRGKRTRVFHDSPSDGASLHESLYTFHTPETCMVGSPVSSLQWLSAQKSTRSTRSEEKLTSRAPCHTRIKEYRHSFLSRKKYCSFCDILYIQVYIKNFQSLFGIYYSWSFFTGCMDEEMFNKRLILPSQIVCIWTFIREVKVHHF